MSGHTASSYQADIFRFQSHGDGHGIVAAVAGSGKTTTLVEMANRINPYSRGKALFVAFNKHIADELGKRLPAGVEASTIHRMGLQALSKVVDRAGSKDEWIAGNKYRVLSRDWLKSRGVNPFKRRDLVDAIDRMVSLVMFTLSQPVAADLTAIADHYGVDVPGDIQIEEAVSDVMRWGRDGYGTYKGLREQVSFDDMIYYPNVMEIDLPKYDVLFVDEAQDLNAAQREFVLRLIDGRSMFVGDRNQAIYGFAGADTNSIGKILDRTQAKELPLNVCYRCPVTHLQIAREIVSEIEPAAGAKEGVVRSIKAQDLNKNMETEALILCRMTAPLIDTAFSLIMQGIPCTVRGRDIGRALTQIVDTVESKMFGSRYEEMPIHLDEYAAKHMRILRMRQDNEMAIDSFLDRIRTIETMYAQAITENISSFEGFRKYIEKFFADQATGVVLSTIHKAKGLEAEHVYLIKPEILPHPLAKKPWEIQQERNLKYVALTRAKHSLTFVSTT